MRICFYFYLYLLCILFLFVVYQVWFSLTLCLVSCAAVINGGFFSSLHFPNTLPLKGGISAKPRIYFIDLPENVWIFRRFCFRKWYPHKSKRTSIKSQMKIFWKIKLWKIKFCFLRFPFWNKSIYLSCVRAYFPFHFLIHGRDESRGENLWSWSARNTSVSDFIEKSFLDADYCQEENIKVSDFVRISRSHIFSWWGHKYCGLPMQPLLRIRSIEQNLLFWSYSIDYKWQMRISDQFEHSAGSSGQHIRLTICLHL